jgi:DNA helicase-2/ATP-dependent DNA helicase PcrA
MGNIKLIIAAAGSGKTSFLVNRALENKESKILITTYTDANENEIRKRFYKINNCVPSNVTIQTWFSFLLQHGAKPYQGCKTNKPINGLFLFNGQSAQGIAESNTEKHYFTESHKIYSDKLSKFVVKCNEIYRGEIINRLFRIYSHILIDEVQDLSGYDLELLKLLFASSFNMILVGDPRQGIYSTNNSPKNSRFKKSKIVYFFQDTSFNIDTDDKSLTTNYRSCSAICELSNKLYPHLEKTISGNNTTTGHAGVFFVRSNDVNDYLIKYRSMQLRWDSRTKINESFNVLTFGLSKGIEFDRVLIYPTPQFVEWLKNNNSKLADTSRAKFYVGITRAKYSVGIVFDYDDNTNIEGITKYVNLPTQNIGHNNP